jgi:hypothetical protein
MTAAFRMSWLESGQGEAEKASPKILVASSRCLSRYGGVFPQFRSRRYLRHNSSTTYCPLKPIKGSIIMANNSKGALTRVPWLYYVGVPLIGAPLMGVRLVAAPLMDILLIGGCLSWGCLSLQCLSCRASPRHAFHRRASHMRAFYGRAPHRCASHGVHPMACLSWTWLI